MVRYLLDNFNCDDLGFIFHDMKKEYRETGKIAVRQIGEYEAHEYKIMRPFLDKLSNQIPRWTSDYAQLSHKESYVRVFKDDVETSGTVHKIYLAWGPFDTLKSKVD